MSRILKYTLMTTEVQTLILSDQILSVCEQNNKIVVYALTGPIASATYEFRIIATGQEIDFDTDKYTFLGTVKLYDGKLMLHVFYRQREELKNGH